jgi:4-alpha-glucanotransferase
VVARNLDRYGIPRDRPPIDRELLDDLYVEERAGVLAVAERLGVTEAKVRAGLAHHGIPIRRPGRPGAP